LAFGPRASKTVTYGDRAGSAQNMTCQSFAVRPAADADAHALRECLYDAFEPCRDRYTPGAFADTVNSIEEVRKRLADMALFVAQGRTMKRKMPADLDGRSVAPWR
jgi:hypothetical protein